jgi:hypothetical protein
MSTSRREILKAIPAAARSSPAGAIAPERRRAAL